MSKPTEPTPQMPGSPMTGRDGAVDFVAKASAPIISEQEHMERFSRVLGHAALALWGDLPQEVQEQLFEHAVLLGHQSERDEMLREQLAKFLHDHHRRMAHEAGG